MTTELVVGVTLPITGSLAPQGQEVLRGLELWSRRAEARRGKDIRLCVLDDGSSARRARANAGGFLNEGVDLLFGPYGGAAGRAVANLAEWGRLPIWNHSSSDDEVARRFVITLPTRASKYLVGAIELAAARGCSETLIVASDTRFAARVATGAERRAIARGMHVSSLYIPAREWVARRSEIVSRAATVHLVLLCGALHDDIQTVAALRDRGELRQTIAAVGAGVREFGRALGPLAEGVIGPSQWEPEDATVDVGPRSSTMVMQYRERYGRSPDYLAIQAWACGALAEEAVDRVGPKPDDQWTWASRFAGRTAYGDFRLDQKGRQVGHELRLVEWDAAGTRHVLF